MTVAWHREPSSIDVERRFYLGNYNGWSQLLDDVTQFLESVNNASPYVSPQLMNRTYERVRILDGRAEWLEPIEMTHPPVGEAVPLSVTSLEGQGPMTGHFYRYDHLDGGVIYLPEPDVPRLPTGTAHWKSRWSTRLFR